MSRLRTGGPGVLFLAGTRNFPNPQARDWLWDPPNLILKWQRGSFARSIAAGVSSDLTAPTDVKVKKG